MIKDEGFVYISLFSGGISSFEATLRLLEKHPENTRIWFFDTKIEDQDTYRFIQESEIFFNKKIEIFSEGRNPWQVFLDERFIGNSRITPCNRVLKRQFLEKKIKELFPSKNVVLSFGISKNEERRANIISSKWSNQGIKTEFPLMINCHNTPSPLENFYKFYGVKIPRLYSAGFTHNNCGGACVKAGIKQWILLYKIFPERYVWHEEQEILTRNKLEKNVSILRDRNGRMTKPLTLYDLRLKIES